MTCPSALRQAAQQMMSRAYAPYSHFCVGAACQTASGAIYTGCNIENISYGLTNCAERTAIFTAIAAGERDFTHIVVSANTDEPIVPCGACRQVLLEFIDDQTTIWLMNRTGKLAQTTITQLLPSAFRSLQ